MLIAKSFYAGLFCLCLFFAKALSNVGQKCNPQDIINDQCTSEEQCDATQNNTCQCLPSFTNEKGTCVPPKVTSDYFNLVDNQGNGSLVAGILIPLFLITFVICSIYIGKRYELVKWLRHKLNQRNRNYDEFMIREDDDDDDPPLV